MRFRSIVRPLLCCVGFGLSAVGCGSDSEESKGNQPNGVTQTDDCAGRGEQFSAGMQKTTASGLTIELADANPAPPKLGDNSWTIVSRDATGAPLLSAKVSVDPWMPEHGHGSNKEPIATELGDGKYRLEPIYLGMPGVWEIGVSVSAEKTESVIFAFCIPRS